VLAIKSDDKRKGGSRDAAAFSFHTRLRRKVIMRKLLLLLAITIGLVSHSQAEEKTPEMSRYTIAYSGGTGYRVWVARFGPKENDEVLLQISGIDHKLDGRIIRAKMVPSNAGGSVKYTATVDGQFYELLSVEGTRAVLRVTGAAWSSELCYDKSLAEDRPPQHLLTDYLEGEQQKK
jgi:hypothetical protein